MARRVLIIEDDPASRALLEYLLTAFGYATLPAENGERGLALARQEKPDFIVSDVMLPRLDGVTLARALKADAVTHDIPVIALTILTSPGHRERLLASGFDGYIPKPVVPETLDRQIKTILEA